MLPRLQVVSVVVVALLLGACGGSQPTGHGSQARTSPPSQQAAPKSQLQNPPPPPPAPSSEDASSGAFQAGGLSSAAAWLKQRAHSVAATIPVPGGDVILTSTKHPGWGLYVDTVDKRWAVLPLPLAKLSFERELPDGGLLFLVQGPLDDGSYMPFPYQVLCTPQNGKGSAFATTQGPKFYPLSTAVRFGSKPHAVLNAVLATVDGVQFDFGPQASYEPDFFADYVSAPPTKIRYDAASRTLILDFSQTELGNVDTLASVKNRYVQGVRAAKTSDGLEVQIALASDVKYYTGKITTRPTEQPQPDLQISLASEPPATPWGS